MTLFNTVFSNWNTSDKQIEDTSEWATKLMADMNKLTIDRPRSLEGSPSPYDEDSINAWHDAPSSGFPKSGESGKRIEEEFPQISGDGHDASEGKELDSVDTSKLSLDSNREELDPSPPGYDVFTPTIPTTEASELPDIRMQVRPSTPPIVTKSAKLSSIQNLFTDSQKMAYIGLCYLSIVEYRQRLKDPLQIASLKAYNDWANSFMQRLYTSINVSEEEQIMIKQLAEHGLVPSDLSRSLIDDAAKAGQQLKQAEEERQRLEQQALDDGKPPAGDPVMDLEKHSDIRYTLLSHLFILCICDGLYDARSRSTLRKVAEELNLSWADLIRLENAISEQLRVHDSTTEVKPDAETIVERNAKEQRGRWLFMGLATLGGAAVIGVTAGLAAPLIASGIGAALTTFGVSGGVGVGAFMGGTTGVALIATGGALTGGSMSGMKMLKRTRGISQFEFISIDDAMRKIELHRKERAEKRRKKEKKERKAEAELKAAQLAADPTSSNQHSRQVSQAGSLNLETVTSIDGVDVPDGTSKPVDASGGDLLWEAESAASDPTSTRNSRDVKRPVSALSFTTVSKESSFHNDTSEPTSPKEPKPAKQTNVLMTISGWVKSKDAEDHFSLPFSTLTPGVHGDQYALVWETESLIALGSTMSILFAEVTGFLVQQGIQTFLLPVLMAGLTGPLWLLKLNYLLDNPWGIGLVKAKKTGHILADVLMSGAQENRPVTLIGYSLGARVIFYCLLELAQRNAVGLVEEAYLFGCPVMATKKEWTAIASVVSGRVVNGYLNNDWLLTFLYRASPSLYSDVAGLTPVKDIDGIENVCLDDVIKGHLEYRAGMPKILRHCGFQVDQDYFEDEDDEEEKERAAQEAEKLRIKEEKLKKQQEEYEEKERKRKEAAEAKAAERERKRIEKEIEQKMQAENQRREREIAEKLERERAAERERKRLEKEAEQQRKRIEKELELKREKELAEKFENEFKKKFEAEQRARGIEGVAIPGSSVKSTESKRSSIFGWFAAKPTPNQIITSPPADEKEKAKIDQLLDDYWQPKEIKATLPPLVISSDLLTPASEKSKLSSAASDKMDFDDLKGDVGHMKQGSTSSSVGEPTNIQFPASLHCRPDGYQGPLSTASSSSDIASGASLVPNLGGLPVIRETSKLAGPNSSSNLMDDDVLFENDLE
ncbi:hypothetical protein HDV05_005455 [Chytridiales sp. JEL 0842]|nr:hypothetical protein HDV05_005455 [Chytridiales sp. JEL 0842]